MGTAITKMANFYIFLALAAYATLSAYNFAAFPYDNACASSSSVTDNYVGKYTGETGNGKSVNMDVLPGDYFYFFCNQDMLRSRPPIFPPTPENQPQGAEWMTKEQRFAAVYAWTSVVIVAGVAVVIFNNMVVKTCKAFFWGKTVEVSAMSKNVKGFSEIEDIFGYIPEAHVAGDPYPVLLCDISKDLVGHELISWNDPHQVSDGEHNAIYDLPVLAGTEVFSKVRHWKPFGPCELPPPTDFVN